MEVSDKQSDITESLRPLKCDQNILSRSDGSACYAQGATVVMASIYGPIEPKISKELADRAYVELIYKSKSGIPGVAEHSLEKLLRSTCEQAILTHLHPRTAINITVQEMQDGGGLLAACLNAVNLALMDSGLPLKYLFAAVSCMFDLKDNLVIDPTSRQIKEGYKSLLTFAFDSKDRHLLLAHTEGCVTLKQLKKAEENCRAASSVVFEFYRTAAKRKFSKEFE